MNKLIIVILIGIASNANADTSYFGKSCEQQYKDAWSECNADYYGKCKFLGKKYKPTCDLNIEGKRNSDCANQYKAAWARCNAKYNGKCTYLGNEYKPNCEL